jgi:RNA polymerase sigma-70 factor (ECF subfamily)
MMAAQALKPVFSDRTGLDSDLKGRQFEAVALPHLNDLFRTAVRVVESGAEAEDVVQETYLRAWRAFQRFEPGTDCRAWLFKIMFNEIRRSRRKWSRRAGRLEHAEDPQDELAYAPPVPEDLTDEDVIAALNQVPERFRAVVLLADVQDFSYKEIAKIVHVPVGTVMSRLSRGRRMLRTALAGMAESYGIRTAAPPPQGARACLS